MGAKSYRDLVVWQKAMDFVVEVYRVCNALPDTERYGLAAQLQRAAVSVPSNIAEGEGRNSPGDFKRFLAIAHGSLCETETQLEIAHRLGHLQSSHLESLLARATEIGRMINGLSRSLR